MVIPPLAGGDTTSTSTRYPGRTSTGTGSGILYTGVYRYSFIGLCRTYEVPGNEMARAALQIGPSSLH